MSQPLQDPATNQTILALSLECGQDLTPHGDLQERLQAMCFEANTLTQQLRDFRDLVRAYELTVHNHVPTPPELVQLT